jgi:hypothetical protein
MSEIILISQNPIHWHHALESKLSLLALKFMLPQSRSNYIQDLVESLFNETESHFIESQYKSLLHSGLPVNKINMVNYVLSYINLIDALLEKHIEDLKKNGKFNRV